MRRIVTLLSFSALFAGLAAAESWSGSLLDATCHDRQQSAKEPLKAGDVCVATSQTTAFTLQTGGKYYKLDSAGNQKAMAAFKNRADRTAPGQTLTNIGAKVDGTESNGTITVDKVELQ